MHECKKIPLTNNFIHARLVNASLVLGTGMLARTLCDNFVIIPQSGFDSESTTDCTRRKASRRMKIVSITSENICRTPTVTYVTMASEIIK